MVDWSRGLNKCKVDHISGGQCVKFVTVMVVKEISTSDVYGSDGGEMRSLK